MAAPSRCGRMLDCMPALTGFDLVGVLLRFMRFCWVREGEGRGPKPLSSGAAVVGGLLVRCSRR